MWGKWLRIRQKTRSKTWLVLYKIIISLQLINCEQETYLQSIAELSNPRTYPAETVSAREAYADSDTVPSEVQRLKDVFKDMSLKGNTKVTSERVFSMCVHPEKTKTLVLVGDKYGQLGMYVLPFKKGGGWFELIRNLRWDALGPAMEKPENEDDTSGLKAEENENEYQEGRVWRVQAHAKNSISCIKVDPVNGSGVSRPHTQIIAWPFDFYLTRRKIAFFYCI